MVHRMPRASRRASPVVESLEARRCLSLAVQFDYSLDTSGFFNDPARRAMLQTAADTLGSRISDNLAAITPSGGNTWTATFTNPATGLGDTRSNPVIPANTLVVFAGARAFSNGSIGQGGPGGFSSRGDSSWNNLVFSRGQVGALLATPTDFGPWGGAISFDTSRNWYFGTEAAGISPQQDDFLSVALHEMTHLLGFGTASSFTRQVSAGRFLGPQATLAYDGSGSPPLNAGGDHWRNGTTDAGFEVAMDPTLLQGTRKLLTPLDFAALGDLGWSLAPDTDATIATATVRSSLNITLASVGGTFSDSGTMLENPTDVDLYRVTIDHPDVLDFSSSPFTFLRVFDGTGKEIARSTTSLGAVTATLPSAGTYYLGVSGAGNHRYSPLEPLSQIQAGSTGSYFVRYTRQGVAGGGAPVSDLVVSVSGSPTGTQGSPLSQTILVTNDGPDMAENVQLSAIFPTSATFVSIITSQGTAGLVGGAPVAAIGNLAAGAGVLVVVQIIPNTPGALSFHASAVATTTELDTSDNSASASIAVSPSSLTLPGEKPPAPSPPPVSVTNVEVRRDRVRGRFSTSLIVTFSSPINASSAVAKANYRLVKPGRSRRRRASRDVVFRLRPPRFDGHSTVTLVPASNGRLPKGLSLTIAAAIVDRLGQALDGNGDGQGGDDAVVVVR